MYDCASDLTSFHNTHVRLSRPAQQKLAEYRETNKDRVEKGLEKLEKPMPLRYVNQGSYAMDTINQASNNDYDIDVGVVFTEDDLVGPQGGKLSPLEARKRIHEAVSDDKFKKAPVVKKNCVRIYYNEGHHVDMPVYREITDVLGNTKLELASSEWIKTDPEAVTEWFKKNVKTWSPDETNGRQMRRVVRLIKAWANSRTSWNMPTGFIISKLVVDHPFYLAKDRDDKALYDTLKAIRNTLIINKKVMHPILTDIPISEGKEAAMEEMYTRLNDALDNMQPLFAPDCTRQAALKIWGQFFDHTFFTDLLKNSDKLAESEPGGYVIKKGGERLA